MNWYNKMEYNSDRSVTKKEGNSRSDKIDCFFVLPFSKSLKEMKEKLYYEVFLAYVEDLSENRYHGNGSDYRKIIYEVYLRLVEKFKKYSNDPYQFGSNEWGEDSFLIEFGSCIEEENEPNMASKGILDNIVCLKQYEDTSKNYLHLNRKNNYNLMLNALRNAELAHRLNKISEQADPNSYLLRTLFTTRVLTLRKEIDSLNQFTFLGERYVAAKSALSDKLPKAKGDFINVIPFRHTEALSSIDSTRLIEKVKQQIIYKEKLNDAFEKEIRIAVFGVFADKPLYESEKHNIERLAETGFFNDYRVSITYFSIKKMLDSSIVFEENDCNIKKENRISGDLYDHRFLEAVAEKYDITCLLDMGCLYADTCRGLDFRKSSPYEEVVDCIRVIDVQKERDGLYGINILSYINFYTTLLKWIEFTFYGTNHQYEFDPRLYSSLIKMRKAIALDRSIYTYLSRNRGEALVKNLKHSELCCTELYNGVALTVYDWRKTDEGVDRISQNEYCAKIFKAEPQNKLKIRFWKLLKSIDDYFFKTTFTSLFKDGLDVVGTEESADLDFVKFCFHTTIEFDYSRLKRDGLIEYSLYTKYGDNAICEKYLSVAESIMDTILKLVFEQSCYDDCSSLYYRRILSNVISADANSLEHLMLSHMIINRRLNCTFTHAKSIISDSYSIHQELEEEPEHIRLRHIVNGIIEDAISILNIKSYTLFMDARDELYDAMPDHMDEIDPGTALRKLGTVCDCLGFSNCTIAVCCR